MNKTNKTLLTVIVVLVIAILGFASWKVFFEKDSWSAVYLKTGDLYFGKLQTFPSYGLSQVYLFQVNKENTQNPLSVQRFKNVFWGPEDFLSLNREEVVWTAKLRSESELVKLVEANPDLNAPQGQQPSAQQPQAPADKKAGSAETNR